MAIKNLEDEYSSLLWEVGFSAGKQIRILLETKHLYQNLSFSIEESLSKLKKNADREQSAQIDKFVNDTLLHVRLFLSAENYESETRTAKLPDGASSVSLGNIKLFCRTCKSRELYSVLWYRDIHEALQSVKRFSPPFGSWDSRLQIFCVAYQCQNCKDEPEVFVIRRQGWVLSIEGRSPMEHIEVPNYIPKKERHLYRDAVIAFNAGKPLAGLFYLRSFIEQFARRQTALGNSKATGDEIMAAYSALLPAAQRDQIPSLKDWYSQLSAPIHAAKADEQIFEKAIEEIDRHFDFRRIFRIPDAESKPAS